MYFRSFLMVVSVLWRLSLPSALHKVSVLDLCFFLLISVLILKFRLIGCLIAITLLFWLVLNICSSCRTLKVWIIRLKRHHRLNRRPIDIVCIDPDRGWAIWISSMVVLLFQDNHWIVKPSPFRTKSIWLKEKSNGSYFNFFFLLIDWKVLFLHVRLLLVNSFLFIEA